MEKQERGEKAGMKVQINRAGGCCAYMCWERNRTELVAQITAQECVTFQQQTRGIWISTLNPLAKGGLTITTVTGGLQAILMSASSASRTATCNEGTL